MAVIGGLLIRNIQPADIIGGISNSLVNAEVAQGLVRTTDLSMQNGTVSIDDSERGTEQATFMSWIQDISKGGFGSPTITELLENETALRTIFDKITYTTGDVCNYSSHYCRKKIESNIRKSYMDKRDFSTKEELVAEALSLLNIVNFKTEIKTEHPENYYPGSELVERIIDDDEGKLKPDENTMKLLKLAEETGNKAIVESIRSQYTSHPKKDRSFHYLPYRMDSGFEQTYLKDTLELEDIEKYGLEVYYNGDRAMTEFKIKCYKATTGKWHYIGIYTPDFLIIQRREKKIYKIVIVETKGEIYSNDPRFKDKRDFMQEQFTKINNKEFGYERFQYLYLEDSLPDTERKIRTHKAISDFFEEVIENGN